MASRGGLLFVGALAAQGLVGCVEEEKEESAPPVETDPQESADDCVGGAAPVITAMELENSGLQRFENDDYPTLTVWVEVEDEDWDLATYRLEVYYDETVDGAVEQSSTNGFDNAGTLSDDGECTAPGGTVGLVIGITGAGVSYDTLTEFGALVTDGNGVQSEMATTSGYTPTSTGEDGGP